MLCIIIVAITSVKPNRVDSVNWQRRNFSSRLSAATQREKRGVSLVSGSGSEVHKHVRNYTRQTHKKVLAGLAFCAGDTTTRQMRLCWRCVISRRFDPQRFQTNSLGVWAVCCAVNARHKHAHVDRFCVHDNVAIARNGRDLAQMLWRLKQEYRMGLTVSMRNNCDRVKQSMHLSVRFDLPALDELDDAVFVVFALRFCWRCCSCCCWWTSLLPIWCTLLLSSATTATAAVAAVETATAVAAAVDTAQMWAIFDSVGPPRPILCELQTLALDDVSLLFDWGCCCCVCCCCCCCCCIPIGSHSMRRLRLAWSGCCCCCMCCNCCCKANVPPAPPLPPSCWFESRLVSGCMPEKARICGWHWRWFRK